MEVGRKLCEGILIYCDIEIPRQVSNLSLDDFDKEISEESKSVDRKKLVAELLQDKALLNMGSKDDSEGGSDSEPSEDNMDQDEISRLIPIKIPKRKNKVGTSVAPSLKKNFKQVEI